MASGSVPMSFILFLTVLIVSPVVLAIKYKKYKRQSNEIAAALAREMVERKELENHLDAARLCNSAWFSRIVSAKEAEMEAQQKTGFHVSQWYDEDEIRRRCLAPIQNEEEMFQRLRTVTSESEGVRIISEYVPRTIELLIEHRGSYLFDGMDPADEDRFEYLMKRYGVKPKPVYALASSEDFKRITADGWRKK